MAFEDNCADCLTLIASGLFNTSDHICVEETNDVFNTKLQLILQEETFSQIQK